MATINAPILNQKVALITGAGSGIGRAAAELFYQHGALLVLCDIDSDALAHTTTHLKKSGAELVSVHADISSEEEIQAMVEAAIENFGQLDIAVNNAGVEGSPAKTDEYTMAQWNKVLNINLRGQWLCMKYEIPAMLKKGGGSIVNISSILGVVGYSGAPAYTASKHGLIGLTKTAALEYSAQGVRVNAVRPAFIETPMLERAGITTDEEIKQQMEALHPMGRLGKAEEVAEAILWLASDKSSFVSGHTLLVDGGYTAQ